MKNCMRGVETSFDPENVRIKDYANSEIFENM